MDEQDRVNPKEHVCIVTFSGDELDSLYLICGKDKDGETMLDVEPIDIEQAIKDSVFFAANLSKLGSIGVSLVLKSEKHLELDGKLLSYSSEGTFPFNSESIKHYLD